MPADLRANARLQRLEDREHPVTWLDYCNRLDLGDFAGLGDVFAEDAGLEMSGLAASLDGTYHGRQSIIEDFYSRTRLPSSTSGTPRFMTGHLSTNLQIDLDGDEATTLAYFFEIVDDNLVLIGTYQHRLRREPDRWRFAFLGSPCVIAPASRPARWSAALPDTGEARLNSAVVGGELRLGFAGDARAMRRGWVMSNGVPRCMRRRLSQMTASPTPLVAVHCEALGTPVR
jgi:hypothetical protein